MLAFENCADNSASLLDEAEGFLSCEFIIFRLVPKVLFLAKVVRGTGLVRLRIAAQGYLDEGGLRRGAQGGKLAAPRVRGVDMDVSGWNAPNGGSTLSMLQSEMSPIRLCTRLA